MAPRQKGKKKIARSNVGDNKEGTDPTRQCTTSTRATTSTATTVSVKKEEEELEVAGGSYLSNNSLVPDSVASAADPRNAATATTTTNNSDADNNELPTPVELSKKLCRIVDLDRYSRSEACRALDKLFQWAYKEDPEYLKYYLTHAGIIKVIDFLKGTICTIQVVLAQSNSNIGFTKDEDLLEESDDYEIILPFLAVDLKKFGSNQHSNKILANAITLIHGACDSINDKKIIEKSGVMEHLSVLSASNNINEDQKKKVREVIGKITAP